jgi:predicted HicB family RNase H-like nuclease
MSVHDHAIRHSQQRRQHDVMTSFRGSFSPAMAKRPNLSFRSDERTLRRLRVYAAAEGRSLNELIQRILVSDNRPSVRATPTRKMNSSFRADDQVRKVLSKRANATGMSLNGYLHEQVTRWLASRSESEKEAVANLMRLRGPRRSRI